MNIPVTPGFFKINPQKAWNRMPQKLSNEFKPKYRKDLWIGLFFLPLSVVFLGPQIIENPAKDPNLTICWLCILFMTSMLPIILIRRIRFDDHFFTVENYYGKAKKIIYGDVIRVGSALVRYKGGKISLYRMTNREELVKSLSERVVLNETGKFKEAARKGSKFRKGPRS